MAMRVMGSKSTKLGTPSAPPTSTHARPRRLDHCPSCGTPFEDRPFCGRDGMLAEPFDVGERYRIEETLGAGGMALVFGARHQVLGKPVAVKLLRTELAADSDQCHRFLREGRLASQLTHENIVSVIDFGNDRTLGLPYLVMDRLRGPTLAEVMRENGKITVERAVPILVQLARALVAAHEQGVIHRDLTPKNVVLEESSGRRDVVKLCDFGVSRTIEGDDRVTTTGQMIGTPAYMAPEQIRGEVDQDSRVDIYALGAVAHEMLTGELPHQASTAVAMIAAKLRDEVEPIAKRFPTLGLPHSLESAILRCLEIDPDERPSAAELSTVLTQISLSSVKVVEPADLVGRMVGSYRVNALLGTGGMGSVYRAEHPEIGTQVAIKVLLPEVAASSEVVERFTREARASGAIGSPHIPRYYDFGRLSDGRAYAIMEYLEGESLAERLERCGPMTVKETASLLVQVAGALGEAHALGIIHRDIKPDNLFLAYDKRGNESIKVLDFGIAKVVTQAQGGVKLTQQGSFIGTPVYCAPEQIFGQAVGPQTDVYALGATAYEMLTGRPPYDGDLSDIFAAKAHARPPSVRAIDARMPWAIDTTLARALACQASERFATMHELAASLATWTEEPVVEAVVAPKRRSFAIAAIALALVGVIAIAGALLVFLSSSDPATPEMSAPAVQPAPPPFVSPPTPPPPADVVPTPIPTGIDPETIVPTQPAPAPVQQVAPAMVPAPEPTVQTPQPVQRPREARRISRPPTPRPVARPLAPSGARPIIADPFAE